MQAAGIRTAMTTVNSLEETAQFARRIGERLRGGELLLLTSDLGGGKTTFVQSLVAGAGSSDPVSSPSFTIKNEYTAPRFTIHHYDFYRLLDPGILRIELEEALSDPRAVVVIEWGEIVSGSLPDQRLEIDIIPSGQSSRRFVCRFPESLDYLELASGENHV